MDKVDCRYYATGGGQNYLPEPTIWLAVKDEDAHMLADDVYDAFLLVPLYIGMYYKQDLHIHGCVSKRLYRNVMNYLQRILCDYSNNLSRINIHVDGFKIADGEQNIIGTGLSCGVDSLSTVYDRFVKEDDPDYRINALFFFNTGWHGDYYDERTKKLCINRYSMNKSASDELGLPLHWIESNFHAFNAIVVSVTECGGYLANYSCVLGTQKAVRKYYVASSYSYNEMHMFDRRGGDLSAFAESYMIPLLSTESVELIVDGCQYERGRKTENISEWDIAHRYLNPCQSHSNDTDDPHNCSKCNKCMRTMLTLEIIGKLKYFSGTFDIDVYNKHSFRYKCGTVLERKKDAHKFENCSLAHKYGFKLPSYFTAYLYLFPSRLKRFTKRTARKLMGEKL
ncbi:MAG: hypothetical protein IJP97_03790, partial [Synergistaceae bacterium]|nr:hypothetical protein [Synergistaceae bacterium]